jgi:hypothetical protein
MLTPPTTAVFLQQDFATGQSSANTQDTLCDSNQSNPLISGAIKQFQGDFLVECAANNVIVLLIPEVNSKWGFSAADYIMSRSNYTIEDVETFGLPGEANTRIIMSTK